MGDKVKVVLAVNVILYEFFQKITPLNNQEIITDSTEISNILEQYEISSHRIFHKTTSEKPSVDIFIVKANDGIINIIDVVQRNMEFILVITHRDVIIKTIKDNYALFIKNNNLGGGATVPPNPPKPPSKKVKNKSQSLSTKGIDLGLDDEFDLI
jgi:hypothetical protein